MNEDRIHNTYLVYISNFWYIALEGLMTNTKKQKKGYKIKSIK